ncbi:MAG TPA: NAD(P)/FAD-dependent oxidoreductase [Candidatus Limnocylindrales bacterium]|nr:NAD(P)/FAD-dependent oxidoreductase [Candidatus Limnocylindrales bacterium]
MKKQHILVVGGGFGGIKAALELADDIRFSVTLVSDSDSFRYYPTLYHTATGGKHANACIPVSEIFDQKEVKVVQGSATGIDRRAKVLTLSDGRAISYDIAVLGLGVVTNFFGVPGMAEHSFSIKSQAEVIRFKQHIHEQLEDERRPDLSYVIVGGGPTGIELAGALPAYIHETMQRHGIKNRAVHVDLIEAGPRLLPRMPRDTSRLITRRLKRLGVRVRTSSAVQALSADDLTVNGKPIRSHTVVWTAGVTNHPFFKDNAFNLTPRGKVATDMYLQADENVYVIGDNANTPYSGMAQTALHDGLYVADTIKRRADGKEPRSYKVKKPITVIPVGERWAAVMWGSVRIYGILGWGLREAADYIAFNDYEPWWKAHKQWLTGFGHEEECDVCIAYEAAPEYSGM